MSEWKASYVIDPTGRSGTLYLYQRHPSGGTSVVVGIDTRDEPTMTMVDVGVQVDGGLRLSADMVQAIADAINPPDEMSKGEIARLEEALEHERQRVDNILDRWVPER